jgi:hypothetical protein
MTICEFCIHYRAEGACGLGLNLPKRMGCRDFEPGLDKFCGNPNDFVSANQLVQMAAYFGIRGMEMKKVKLMAAQEEKIRASASHTASDTLAISQS